VSEQLPAPPAAQTGAACRVCGAHTLASREHKLTTKRRSKFGFLWLLATILTGGIGLLIYLVWPRHNEVTGVDRWLECTSCGARQV
jgi:hypothetical protein